MLTVSNEYKILVGTGGHIALGKGAQADYLCLQ